MWIASASSAQSAATACVINGKIPAIVPRIAQPIPLSLNISTGFWDDRWEDSFSDLLEEHQLPSLQLLQAKLEAESLRKEADANAKVELKQLSSLLELSEDQQDRARNALSEIVAKETRFFSFPTYNVITESPWYSSRLKAFAPVLSEAQLKSYKASLDEQ